MVTQYLGGSGVVHGGLDGDPLRCVEHHPEDASIVLDPPDRVLHPLGQLLDFITVFALLKVTRYKRQNQSIFIIT